jgi:hypothetical protein
MNNKPYLLGHEWLNSLDQDQSYTLNCQPHLIKHDRQLVQIITSHICYSMADLFTGSRSAVYTRFCDQPHSLDLTNRSAPIHGKPYLLDHEWLNLLDQDQPYTLDCDQPHLIKHDRQLVQIITSHICYSMADLFTGSQSAVYTRFCDQPHSLDLTNRSAPIHGKPHLLDHEWLNSLDQEQPYTLDFVTSHIQ